MEKSKIETYLGFCIRSGKIAFGTDNVDKQKKGVQLLLADASMGDSSFKTILKAKERFACPLLIVDAGILGERLHRPAVKAVAITDKNLASAILTCVDSELQFKLYSGGNN